MQQRYFQKPEGRPINEKVVAVVFDLSGDHVKSYSIDKNGERKLGANWTLKDALSLVESGHWIELRDKDEPGSEAELEGGAW